MARMTPPTSNEDQAQNQVATINENLVEADQMVFLTLAILGGL